MKNIPNFTNKKILVCGLAKSGVSVAQFLAGQNAQVTAQDTKPTITEETAAALSHKNITLYLGKNPDEIIRNFDMVIISPGVPFDLPFLQQARQLNIPVWGELELAYRFCPAPIMAITGTNGKTTVTTLMGEILQRHNQKTVVAGNIGIPFTEYIGKLSPDNWVVLEVSSFQLETIHHFAPKISAILNITPDHLDRHKSMEIYRYTKERIFENQSEHDFVVLSYETFSAAQPKCSTIFFSAKQPLKTGVFLENGIITAKMPNNSEKLQILEISKTKILPENALAATALALCVNVPVKIIAETLQNFKGVPHRMEFVRQLNGVEFYNDSKATNTDAAIKAIEPLTSPTILIAGGYDKKADFTEWVQHFGGKIKHLIVMGETAEQIIKTCQANNYKQYSQAASMADAVNLAHKKAQNGDIILLSPACASWDMFDNFEHRGDLFKELVANLKA
ncbi:MAG: UDP-N-acetylmuramoyl-L-alanine--D-glutamate ligase [Defluviitaleaceae bacterium]|nr:UDP-N-acetylmuramoyl-L-alanine--D-glutamate ligase [Defluviitaleaceae bacterium]